MELNEKLMYLRAIEIYKKISYSTPLQIQRVFKRNLAVKKPFFVNFEAVL